MKTTTLKEIIEMLKTLTPAELEYIKNHIDEICPRKAD